jgi:hypothetical protein
MHLRKKLKGLTLVKGVSLYGKSEIISIKGGSPVCEDPALRGVWGRVGPHWVIVRSLSLQFLQEAVSTT